MNNSSKDSVQECKADLCCVVSLSETGIRRAVLQKLKNRLSSEEELKQFELLRRAGMGGSY